MRQAITTKYLGPTNYRPGRIKAEAYAGSVTVEYDSGLSQAANHARAAKALCDKYQWGGTWVVGAMPNERGNVYIDVSGQDPKEGFLGGHVLSVRLQGAIGAFERRPFDGVTRREAMELAHSQGFEVGGGL